MNSTNQLIRNTMLCSVSCWSLSLDSWNIFPNWIIIFHQISEKYFRMTLLITIFLVLVNIFNTITTNIPKAEGLTAIEAFVIVCVLFVFGALMGKIFINETKEIFLLMEDYTEYISSRGLSDRLPKIGEIQICWWFVCQNFWQFTKTDTLCHRDLVGNF